MMRSNTVTASFSNQLNRYIGVCGFHNTAFTPTFYNSPTRLGSSNKHFVDKNQFSSLAKIPHQSYRLTSQDSIKFKNYMGRVAFSTSSSSSGSEIFASFPDEKKTSFEGNNVEGAMQALANADAVCFDVDSTVIQEEGIDVLAGFLGKGQEVADFTARAMGGSLKFEDALAARLDLMKPSKSSIEQCLEAHPIPFSPGIDRLIETLHVHGIDVYFVSGGFRIMIEPVARELMVSKTNIYANTLLFDDKDDDTYKGFDPTEPTSADGGKPKALMEIKNKCGYNTMIMVGDGATDAQAKPPADAFIGFGGVVVREAVKEKSCWFVKDFEDMITVVEKFAPKERRHNQ